MKKSKDTNTFRFKSFADRIKEIDLRCLALYHVGHENEDLFEDIDETYFHQTLKKWVVLNLTDEFSKFSRKIRNIVTLPQLLHQKDVVVDLLLNELATASALYLQPLLELLYVLARDLREDFYCYFHRVLDRLICLLNTQDADQLEWTLVCLAHLFKALKPYLKRNLGIVFYCILPLLDEQHYAEHISNFAVECFSYIARDVRDFRKFMDFILETILREQFENIQSCGRLLFEIMRGVKGDFHSTAESFLQFIFEYMVDDIHTNVKQIILLNDIVRYTIDHLLRFIYPQRMSLFWQKLCNVTDQLENLAKLPNLIRIFHQIVEYKKAKYLVDLEVVIPCLLRLLNKTIENELATLSLQLLTEVIGFILLSGSSLVTQLDICRLLEKTLTIKKTHVEIFENFVLQMIPFVQFDIFILPCLISHLEETFNKRTLELMAMVVIKKHPLSFNGIDLNEWKRLEIVLKKSETYHRIEQKLILFELQIDEIDEEFFLLALIVPHLKGFSYEKFQATFEKTSFELIKLASKSELNQKLLNTLALMVELQCQLNFTISMDLNDALISILKNNLHNLKNLGCLNRLICQNPKHLTNVSELVDILVPLLCHHMHDIRLLAAHSLQVLYLGEELTTPYHIFYKSEQIEPTVHTYREKLLYIQKLEINGQLFRNFKETIYKKHVVYFLLGTLYDNLKFIWQPVLKLIADYANNALESNEFWPIYYQQLQKTTNCIDYTITFQENSVINSNRISTVDWSSKVMNILLPNLVTPMLKQSQLLNYRNLLWQDLAYFGQLFTLKNRELVCMFLNFLADEYENYVERKENFWDLAAFVDKSTLILDKEIEEEIEEEIEKIENEEEDSLKDKTNLLCKVKCNSQSGNVKAILETLNIMLNVFAAHNNPRSLYREPELWNLYMNLLVCSNNSLQKVALDCIMSYKLRALIPHKGLLYTVLDDKKLKDELINFNLNSVESVHREEFMLVLLRLLYGIMMTKGTQKGTNSQNRKSLILRFLGRCEPSEIESFLQLSFKLYMDYTGEDINICSIPKMVSENFNIHAVWSAKKLQSTLNLLELIRKEFVGLMNDKFHYFILKLLIFIGSVCNTVEIIDISKLHAKMPVVFRNTRQCCLQALLNFFLHMEEFNWTNDLITCLTEVFVYPRLEKLPQDSIHNPTVLLKLLLHWGEKPQHFRFLSQKKDNGNCILHYIIALLMNDKAKMTVKKPIITLIDRVLTVASDKNMPFNEEALLLIQPYIPDLLHRLKISFSSRSAKQPIDKQELNILSMLTKHVSNGETCDQLLQLLLPILITKTQSQDSTEIISQIITTLANLIKRLDEPESYLIKLAPLFEHVQEVSARKELCELIADIAHKRQKENPDAEFITHLKLTARIVLMLNAWDKRWVEQPDYEKRLDAFKELSQQINSSNGVEMDLGVIVIYNCFYFFRYDRDIGLRDNAGELLRILIPHLVTKYSYNKQQLSYLLEDVFMSLMRRTIRDSNSNVRYEGIRLLGEIVRKCHTAHIILQDLHPLSNSTDAEVDFFENIIHLQTYRHGRALHKFCNYATSLKNSSLQVRTLTQFILPLASRYLLQDQQIAKHTLIDAAIETIGVVCQLLPWQQYHAVLRYYLLKLRSCKDHQRQCVRIVVRILDSFHFDLSSCHIDTETLKEQQSEIQIQNKSEHESTVLNGKHLPEEDNSENNKIPEDAHDNDLNITLDEHPHSDDDYQDKEIMKKHDVQRKSYFGQTVVLSASASKRVLNTITTILIPTLNRSITEQSNYDTKHKINRKRFSKEREEEDILRVPIALALVKLMQKLPKELLETGLPGIFMKVCTFLRSPLKSIRMLTRDMLKKIMLCLGSNYLDILIDHLQTLLTRGFQVHVLSVTVYGILDALRDQLQPTDVEKCLHNLLDISLNDIFGDISAEKEVEKLVAHTPEAKPSSKSFLVLHIIARNMRETCLIDFLLPFREQLSRSKSKKVTMKIQECFTKIVTGLVDNKNISREALLIFIYGIISQSITDLLPNTQHILTEKEKEQMSRTKPDCFIIQPMVRMRSGIMNKQVKTNVQANAHILIEFGLEMLHVILKRKKLINVDYVVFLTPILPLLKDALKSSHIRVTTFTLKCLVNIWVENYILPAMKEFGYIREIVDRIFEILKNISTFGATKQEDNIQLTCSAFKAIVALLRHCTYFIPSIEQIDQLVLYIEQDLHEGDKQMMTFNLLKAIITRKISSKALHNLMKRVSELAIISPSDHVRDEARNQIFNYLIQYNSKKKFRHVIKFFVEQLCYSVIAGRISAIQLLTTIVKKCSVDSYVEQIDLLYLSLGIRLVNDEDSDCRKMVALCLETLLSRLENSKRQHLFEMTILFLTDSNKPAVREMGAALCSRFLNAEMSNFSVRLKKVLPIIVGRITLSNPNEIGRFVRAPKTSLDMQCDIADENLFIEKQKMLDHEIIQMQYCVLKMFDYCVEELMQNDELLISVDELAYESQRLLAHGHNWVRCNAIKILVHIISNYDFALIGRKLCGKKIDKDDIKSLDFIYSNPEYDIRTLILDLCTQMVPGETSTIIIDEIMKIFLYVATMLRDVPFKLKEELAEKTKTEKNSSINLYWLVRRIRFLINKEVTQAPHSTRMRTGLFTLIEGLITLINSEALEGLTTIFLSVLVREMSDEDQNVDVDLRQLALRVGSRLRKRIGTEVYDKLRARSKLQLTIRRAERKKQVALEKVQDPVRAAKRKAAIQERKKAAKKLKTNLIRGKVADVKQKLKKRKRKIDADSDLF